MLGVLIAAAGILSTASATTALAAPAAAVPWAKAGPGWAVVQYSTGTSPIGKPGKPGRLTLYLTSPQGKKYAIYTWKSSTGAPGALVDWSGDRKRVLLDSQKAYDAPVNIEQISLVTGKVISKFKLPGDVFPIGYTKPDGLNLLAISDDGKLIRYDLHGHQQLVLGSSKGAFSALYTPDGTSVFTTASKGLEEVSNDGGIVKRLPAAAPVFACYPDRWWSAGTVLASCYVHRNSGRARLWLFDVATGRSTVLTPAAIPNSEEGAWRVGGKLYVQADAACQSIYQVYRNNSVHPVTVPGNPAVLMVDSFGARLLLAGLPRCGYTGESLFWFNPATHALSYVFHPKGAATNGVIRIVPFGGTATS
ncbi:MAG TPA: hypothetical protein VFI65_07920 [Streptosporangiaceae bacterium]|nr:hypothetical protein [Streptosporangiaceae bacterium]